MWNILYGYMLSAILVTTVESKTFPIVSKNEQEFETIRVKRQFGFPQNPSRFQNFINNDRIFFDEDNVFNDVVQPPTSRSRIRTTSRPRGPTTVAIPGMGTTQSACEDRCMTTPQYDPVCGDNNITYANMARYMCAVKCGRNVRIAAYRACPRV